jgi:hypothetical protein
MFPRHQRRVPTACSPDFITFLQRGLVCPCRETADRSLVAANQRFNRFCISRTKPCRLQVHSTVTGTSGSSCLLQFTLAGSAAQAPGADVDPFIPTRLISEAPWHTQHLCTRRTATASRASLAGGHRLRPGIHRTKLHHKEMPSAAWTPSLCLTPAGVRPDLTPTELCAAVARSTSVGCTTSSRSGRPAERERQVRRQ